MLEMTRPDYYHSIVNLMASLSHAFGGGDTGYDPLPELPVTLLTGRPVILLVIDGMGAELLQRNPNTFLARHLLTTLSTVFPSTTASAITSFTTGTAPQQHAITGWHMWLREVGSVAAILPFVPRFGGPPFSQSGFSLRQFIGAPPLFDRLTYPCEIFSPDWIVNSDFNRDSGGHAPRHGYCSFTELLQQLQIRITNGAPGYLYAYWAELDALSHLYGSHSPEVERHLLELDVALQIFAEKLEASGALLLVTADHGLIDTDDTHTLFINDHPALAEALTIPLCGEPRTAFCYVRQRHRDRFLGYLNTEMDHCCEVVESEELIAQGYFGDGPPHPELASRIGDYTLLMKERYVLRQQLFYEKPFRHIGVHGGLSRAEMQVPLIALGIDSSESFVD